MTTRILLPALLGSHPLGALASFGLLRLTTEWDSSTRLAFALQDDWVAVLETSDLPSIDTVISKLAEWIASKEVDRTLQWADDVRVTRSEYQHVLVSALSKNDLVLAQFLGAMAADGAVDKQKGLIKPCSFYMVSGQQSFLKGAQEVVAAIRTNPESMFREALEGPWTYQARVHGLGWDPNTERLYALRHKAPTSEKPSCVAGAVVLAMWALALFPTISDDGKAYTTGFTRRKSQQFFSWPVFSKPIHLTELISLLQTGEKAWRSRDGMLRPGIEACYASRRFEFGQGYAVFRPPQLVNSNMSQNKSLD